MNDKQLMKLLHSDPGDGIKEIINTYNSLLITVAMKILKNPQEAEECVADTFINLWKNIYTLRKTDSLRAYLLCVVRNNAIDRYRRVSSRNVFSADSIDGFEIIADDDVELLVIKNEFMSELQAVIMKISEPGREIFMRKYFLLQSRKEIADKLNLTEVQVKDSLYRTRKQIQNNFKKRGINYEEIIFTTAR